MIDGVSIPDVEAAVSILFGNKKQCVSSGYGNWVRDGKRRFVWSLIPYEGERYALTVVAELPVDGLEEGDPAVLVVNDVPCTVFWAYSDSVQKRVAHIGTDAEQTHYVGFVADDKVVRWTELRH